MFFLLYIIDLPDDILCNIAIYVDDANVYCQCDLASDLLQRLGLALELESDIRNTVEWAGSSFWFR